MGGGKEKSSKMRLKGTTEALGKEPVIQSCGTTAEKALSLVGNYLLSAVGVQYRAGLLQKIVADGQVPKGSDSLLPGSTPFRALTEQS